jgi:hypothetical protein
MPKKVFPYNLFGREGTYPWAWTWDVPTSKGTGTPYVVSVRRLEGDGETPIMWGCNCQAGKNGHPICQHRQRVMYDIVTQPDMLRNLPERIREIAAPNVKVVQPNMSNASGSKVVAYDAAGRRNLKAVF